MESNLLGITLAVLTLFEELIETEIDPIRSETSAIAIKHPFSKNKNFIKNILPLSDFAVLITNIFDSLFCISMDRPL